MTFHAKRRDSNESMIVLALRAVGATVQQLNETGTPDLLVGYQGQTHLIECKNPEQPADGKGRTRRGKLRPAQVTWIASWQGSKVHEVVNADEALVAIGALRSGRRGNCCAHPVERHAYNGCANCGCGVRWVDHPDRDLDESIAAMDTRS